ncbi:type IIL restriction-modification enzyme MmeI, partial [Phenylobacterium sp.]|uniref:type IIL restriction-modification enzyme MmeI n=1 Tax=Phenylobacterium sp. TaxID=1871053 RepID=UPI003458E895
ERAEREAFLASEPGAAPFMRPFVGAEEYINGGDRSILFLRDAGPELIRSLPAVAARVAAVRKLRLDSPSAGTRALADFPTRFHITVVPEGSFLCIPEVSSERREYIPIGWLDYPIIPSNKLRIILNAKEYHFSILTSKIHNSWSRYIGGKLKSDFQYSVGVNYNPFPWPLLDDESQDRLKSVALGVLESRSRHSSATLADLYDPDLMPPDLRKAHRDLDIAVDRLYRKEPFADDRERVEHLFRLYEQMTAGLLARADKPKRGRTRKAGTG